jgi:endoglucanase
MERLRTRPMTVRLAAILVALAAGAVLAAAGTPPATNQLQDIPVFKDQLYGTWSGGDIVAPGYVIPIDTTETYGGLPSLRFEVQGPNQWWWVTILAGQDWMPYSVEHYRANGYLEFNVKGTVGGEVFKLQVGDLDNARTPAETTGPEIGSWNHVWLSTEWQHVRIPLSALIPDDQVVPQGTFEPRQLRILRFTEAYWGPYAKTFWINDLKFTSPDREPSPPAIRVNQIGYLPLGEKYAHVADFPEALTVDVGTRFEVRSAANNEIAYAGTLALVDPHEPFVSGEKVLRADFGRLWRPGRYYLVVDASGIDPSPAFEVGWRLYEPALRDATRYFFYQRQGIAIEEPFAEGFARGLGHPGDVAAMMRSSGAVRDVSQGWYDAGDYGKYTPFAAAPVVDLLDAYGMFPYVFGDDSNIPESGNGKADVLDEVKWELDWLLKMQDAESGGFYHLIYPNNCPGSGSCRPEDITEQRYVEDLMGGVPNVRPTASTAKAVAALAHAARAYRHYDDAYADRLLAAAEAGWAYLQANPQNIPATGFNGEQSTDDAERLWAAGELFRTTQKPVYDRYFRDRYQAYAWTWTSTTDNSGYPEMRAFIAYLSAPKAKSEVRNWFRPLYRAWRAQQFARTQKTWRNFLDDGSGDFGSDYYWGSNAVTLATITTIATADRAIGDFFDIELVKAARAQLNYVLGVNPLRKSYVTGFGADSASRIFSAIYSSERYPTAQPPGILAEGPNQYQGWRYSRFFGKCYADTNTDWTVSEHAIYYNASLVFVLALADGTAVVPAY